MRGVRVGYVRVVRVVRVVSVRAVPVRVVPVRVVPVRAVPVAATGSLQATEGCVFGSGRRSDDGFCSTAGRHQYDQSLT
jgi:hypothetical protein